MPYCRRRYIPARRRDGGVRRQTLSWSGVQPLLDVASQQVVKMLRRATSFRDRMGAVGILHEVEWLAEFNQPVGEALAALEMNVVVSRTVDEEQVAAQAAGEVDCGRGSITVGILLRGPHVALL